MNDEGGKRQRFWAQDEAVPSERGCLVRVFDGDMQIGNYSRNYGAYGSQTFAPFQWESQWFALYSPFYTATRVMSLPDCKDLGGEDDLPEGFCPVEFFIPRYREKISRDSSTGQQFTSWEFSNTQRAFDTQDDEVSFGPWITASTAFVAGCIWGDDNSWKVECIDVPSASKGQIVRAARLGHVELADDRSLGDSMVFELGPHRGLEMRLVRQERRDVATGALIDPYD